MEASDWPDEGDDLGPDPYLPPEQRWWRHPSEIGAGSGGHPPPRPALMPAPGGGRVALVLAAVIGTAGAVLAAYVAHLAQPATSEVATSVVRVSAVTAAPVVTVASTMAPTSAVSTSAVEGLVQLVVPGRSDRSGPRPAVAASLGRGQLVVSAKAVEGVTQVTAVMPDGTEQQADVVYVDQGSGTAVLEVAQPTPTVASGQAATLAPGDPVTAAGTNTPGQVLAVGVGAKADDGSPMEHLMRLRMDAPVEDGTVVLDRSGRAVGICIGHDDAAGTTLLVVPIEMAKAAASEPGPDGERTLPWLGLTGRTAVPEDITAEGAATSSSQPPAAPENGSGNGSSSSSTVDTGATAGRAGTTTSSVAPPTAQPAAAATTTAPEPVEGAYVLSVDEDGPAATAGVQEGDIVVAIDDVPVPSMNSLVLLVRERKPGATVRLAVVRDGQRLEVEAVLQARKHG